MRTSYVLCLMRPMRQVSSKKVLFGLIFRSALLFLSTLLKSLIIALKNFLFVRLVWCFKAICSSLLEVPCIKKTRQVFLVKRQLSLPCLDDSNSTILSQVSCIRRI